MTKVFETGQKFEIKGRGEWKVVDRTRCFVTVRSGITTVRCKISVDVDGVESIAVKQAGVLGRKDYVNASDVIVSEVSEAKEPSSMAKVTAEQAIEAVNVAETEDAIQDVLMTCTKLVMVDVYDAITGAWYTGPALKMKKAELANWIACQIMQWRRDEAFKALPYEEKYEIAMGKKESYEYRGAFNLFSLSELEETVRRLGVCSRIAEESRSIRDKKWVYVDSILQELKIRVKVEKIEDLASKHRDVELRIELENVTPVSVLERLSKKNGLLVKSRVEMIEELLKYYTSSSQPLEVPLASSEGTQQTSPEEVRPMTNEPVKFQLGHHYRDDGAAPQSVYTFIERNGDCGYFVDTFNVYHRRTIRESGGCEYANSPNGTWRNSASTLSADREEGVHEIISAKNGNASVILHAGQIRNSLELEELLKEAARKKTQCKENPAVEESIVEAKSTEEIRAILEKLTKEELKVYAARNLMTGAIPLKGDILSSLVKATEATLSLFRHIWEVDSQSEESRPTPTTPLSKAWSEMQDLKCERRRLQRELHKQWLKRRAVMKAQRTAKISREEYEALGEMWEHASSELSRLFEDYRRVCHELSEGRCEHAEITSGCEEGVSDTANAGVGRSEDAA